MAMTISGFILVICILVGVYAFNLRQINRSYYREYYNKNGVALRKFPYPYRSALTLCSDIDQTGSAEEFLEIQGYLNTEDPTRMGTGVGLEIGNSFFMFEPNSRFSYFSGRKEDKQVIRDYVDRGLLDCMHSYGEKHDFSREDARRSIVELSEFDHNIDIWIDHTKTIDNLGKDVTAGEGDVRESSAYHSDLTIDYGFKFFWLGRLSSVVGQETPITLGMFINRLDPDHILYSSINMLKEFLKHVLAVFGNHKYAFHKDNQVLRLRCLHDGQRVFEFIRCDNHWRGVGEGAYSEGLAYVISKKNLKRLIKSRGYMIVYTHLGKNAGCKEVVPKETQEALRWLSLENKSGNIYVTTTSKLLNYCAARKHLIWQAETRSDTMHIKVLGVHDPLTGKDFLPKLFEYST